MRRSILAVIALAMLSGCVSTKIVPVKESDIASLQGGKISVARREKPSFAAVTAGKAMFGAIGGAAMVVAGNDIVKKNAVEDPALRIGNELMKGLADANVMTVVNNDGIVATATTANELARQYPNTDVLLDVQTVNWSFGYFATDWNNYRVVYSAKMRLIDVKKSKLLAEGFCARVPESGEGAPSHEELLKDQAARLKHELSLAADHCVHEFRDKVLMQSGGASAVSAAR